MNKPLLSICIPTYNRCEYLKNTLNSIICQKDFQNGIVEVVISDNASTDETEQVVRNYASRFENICYFKNPENIFDKNFPLVLNRGKGIYRKLYNDTLLCVPGTLRYICDLIKQYSGTEKPLFMLNGNRKNLKEEMIECTNFSQFVRIAGIWTGWIGAFGLWESECERITADISGCEIKLWQCKTVYEIVEKKEECVVINRRLFFNQEVTKKDLSYGVYQVLQLNYLSILRNYIKKGLISRQTYENIRIDNLYRLSFFIIFSEMKKQQWNIPDVARTKSLICNEMKKLGIWEEYQRYYKKRKLFYKVWTVVRAFILKIYCSCLAFYVHAINKNTKKTGAEH